MLETEEKADPISQAVCSGEHRTIMLDMKRMVCRIHFYSWNSYVGVIFISMTTFYIVMGGGVEFEFFHSFCSKLGLLRYHLQRVKSIPLGCTSQCTLTKFRIVRS